MKKKIDPKVKARFNVLKKRHKLSNDELAKIFGYKDATSYMNGSNSDHYKLVFVTAYDMALSGDRADRKLIEKMRLMLEKIK